VVVKKEKKSNKKSAGTSASEKTDENNAFLKDDSLGQKPQMCCTDCSTLSVPRRAYFNDPCRFISCWIRQKTATKFPKIKGILKYNASDAQYKINKRGEGFSDVDISFPKDSKRISSGAFGSIYTATLKQSGSKTEKKVVVKINEGRDDDKLLDVLEGIMQVALFCHLRKSTMPFHYAKIPKIVTLASIKKETRDLGLEDINLIAMESLDGSLKNLISSVIDSTQSKRKRMEYVRNILTTCLLQIATTLFVLQRDLLFEHRDMHASNIMYSTKTQNDWQYFKSGTRNDYQFYIIDFGQSRLTHRLNGKVHKIKGMDIGTWPDAIGPGGDIATACVFLYDFVIASNMGYKYPDEWNSKKNYFPVWLHPAMEGLLQKMKDHKNADPDDIYPIVVQNQPHWNVSGDQRQYYKTELEPFHPRQILKSMFEHQQQDPKQTMDAYQKLTQLERMKK